MFAYTVIMLTFALDSMCKIYTLVGGVKQKLLTYTTFLPL